MTKKTGVLATSKDFVINSTLTTIGIAAGSALLSGDALLPWQVSAGLFVTAGSMLMRRNLPTGNGQRLNSTFARSVTYTPGDWSQAERQTSGAMFVYDAPNLATPVIEPVFNRFVRLAVNRQQGRYYANATNTNGRRLKSHELLSAVYFTRRLQPAMTLEQVNACKYILSVTGWLHGWRKGHGGILLISERTTPEYLADNTRRQWVAMYAPTTPQGNHNALRRVFSS